MLSGTYEFQVVPVPHEIMAEYDGFDPTGMAPAELPPKHRLTFLDAGGYPVGIYESEHGKQMVGNLMWDGPVIRFTALAGTPGDELFFYEVQLEGDAIKGSAYQAGKPKSPLSGVKIG